MATTVSRVDERSQTSTAEHTAEPDTDEAGHLTGADAVTEDSSTEDKPSGSGQLDNHNDGGSDGDEQEGPTDTTTTDRPRRRRFTALLLVCVALIFAAAAAGTVYFDQHTSAVSDIDRDTEIVSTAKQVVTNLVTLRGDTADADVRRIEESTTGDFQKQFTDATGSFATVLTQGEVESTGEATEAALVSADDKSATVIAAVTSTVKNSEAPEGQQRVYRMKLTLENIKGRWLASNVEFVS
jgi:Mce-associated membrane protein